MKAAGFGSPTSRMARLSMPAGRGLVDLARVELRFEDVDGDEQSAYGRAQASFTADASLYSQPPTAIAVEGAKAEMAGIAQQAARMQEAGKREEAKAQVVQMKKVAAAVKAEEAMDIAIDFGKDIQSIESAGSPAAKSVKQKAFDAVRAPVAGW